MSILVWWGILIAFLLSAITTGMMRKYAVRAKLLDIPNQRSSHQVVTPRGGGLGIVVVFLGGMLLLYLLDVIPMRVFLGFVLGGLLTAGIGFADDHSHIPARWRSVVHFLAAITALVLIGGLPAIRFGSATVDLGIVGDVLAAVFIVWMINLFNFMDGIDGIAAVEVICVASGAWLIAAIPEGSYVGAILGLLIASTLGFLVWNWSPAKIFMGDVGSGFVGFALAAIALATSTLGVITIWSWLILAGVFLVDATVTLVVRVWSGQAWYKAHNSHAYQILARRFESHRKVTLGVLVINVFWLLPLGFLAAEYPYWGLVIFCVALLPLLILALNIGAGSDDRELVRNSSH